MEEEYMATIKLFAGVFEPRGWYFCDGRVLPINEFQALFSLLSNVYGGDGRTTFALPDLRGRFPTHPGTAPGVKYGGQLGVPGGSESLVLSVEQLPNHSHKLLAANVPADEDTPSNNSLGIKEYYAPGDPTIAMRSGSIGGTGDGTPVNYKSPYLPLNFIICFQGVYPPRND